MKAWPRWLFLVLVPSAAALAETEPATAELPGIFSGLAPRHFAGVNRLAPDPALKPRLPLSSQMRSQLRERARTEAGALPVTARAPTRPWYLQQGDAIVMDRFVVNVPPEKKVEPERAMNPIYQAFSTGVLFRRAGSSGSPELFWALNHVPPPVLGTASTAPRVELGLAWRW